MISKSAWATDLSPKEDGLTKAESLQQGVTSRKPIPWVP